MADKVEKYLSVRVGSQWHGIEVDKVIEVLHMVAFSELPTRRNDILGLITVRDEVMPLIDLRLHFGMKDAPLKLDSPLIAVREATGSMALICDDTDRVEEIRASQMTKVSESQYGAYVRGVAKLSGRLLLLLDTARISAEIQLS